MVADKPIVAFKVDAIPEIIIDGYNGLLVKANDLPAFAQAIFFLYSDKNLGRKLVINGRDWVRKSFDVTRVAEEHERVFVRLYEKIYI